MKRTGIVLGAALLVGAFMAVGRNVINSAKQLNWQLSNYFKLSNIKILNSDLSFAFKVTNTNTTPVAYSNVNFTGNVIYGGKSIADVNNTQSITLQPAETKIINISVQLNHLKIGQSIISVIKDGNATALTLIGTVRYGVVSFPINQKLNLLKVAGISGRALINGIAGYFDLTEISTLDDLKKQYFKLAKTHHPDAGGTTADFQNLQAEYEILIRKILNGTNLSSEEKNNEIVIDENLRQAIDTVIHLPGISIDLVGKWIWISGNTFPIKDFLKNAGFVFFKKAGTAYWVFKGVESHSRGGTALQDIYNKYGKKNISPRPGNNYLGKAPANILRADYAKYANANYF